MKSAVATRTRQTRGPSEAQQALDRAMMHWLCDMPTGRDGHVYQVWAKYTDTQTRAQCVTPVCYYDTDNIDTVMDKVWDRAYITQSQSREMYVTINPMYPWSAGQTTGIKGADRCAYVRAVYIDVDAHGVTDVDTLSRAERAIIQAIDGGRLVDCSLTATGRGYGLFLRLSGPLNPNSKTAMQQYRAVCQALADQVAYIVRDIPGMTVDPAVIGDIARIARIPGSYNPASRTYCRAVRVSETDYGLSELADLLGVELEPEPQAVTLPRLAPVYQGAEIERLQAYAADCPITEGQRYTYLWTCAEVLARPNRGLSDTDRAMIRSINANLSAPLPSAEVAHAIREAIAAANKPNRNGGVGVLPSGKEIADRLGMTEAQRTQYGIGDGHKGHKPQAGPRVSVPVDGLAAALRDALQLTGKEMYAAIEAVQPMLTPAVRAEIAATDPDIIARLRIAEDKQMARPYAVLIARGDKDGLRELRERHRSNYTRDKARAGRKQEKAAAEAARKEQYAAEQAAIEDKKERAKQLIAAQPDIGTRDVARQTGLSPATVSRMRKDM